MEDAKVYLKQLLDKNELAPGEKEWLLNYLQNSDQQELKSMLEKQFNNDVTNNASINPFLSNRLLNDIHAKIATHKPAQANTFALWIKRVAVAAAVIGIVSYAAYLYLVPVKTSQVAQAQYNHLFKNDVKPGTERASLTLANGSNIILDNVKNGTVLKQGNSKLVKTNGKLAYNAANKDSASIAYNTLATPRAGRYNLQLPDGTLVWLNAASTIKYPTAFMGNERRVTITGEAYFEVAKNKARPFIVTVNNAEVRVYGTHFNIMAYKDEAAVKTTLLEGSVKFVHGASSCMLKPGEQSELTPDGQVKVIARPNAADEVAWKNGLFHFENVDIAVIMRQLARQYDVSVVYNKKVNDSFFAEIPLNVPLSDALKVLELTGKIKFDIKGRQIIVNP